MISFVLVYVLCSMEACSAELMPPVPPVLYTTRQDCQNEAEHFAEKKFAVVCVPLHAGS